MSRARPVPFGIWLQEVARIAVVQMHCKIFEWTGLHKGFHFKQAKYLIPCLDYNEIQNV